MVDCLPQQGRFGTCAELRITAEAIFRVKSRRNPMMTDNLALHKEHPERLPRQHLSACHGHANTRTNRAGGTIQWLWRSLKHEDIYLEGYADGCDVKTGTTK